MKREILHCDLNNFYASVEGLYRPEIKDRPFAVCGSKELRHGIILSKNALAKRMGVRTGEPLHQARQKCPDLLLLPAGFTNYLRFSRMVRDIYARYTAHIESFGIDECWLDVTGAQGGALRAARDILHTVRSETGLTLSIGVSFNKIFAKLGSDMAPDDGYCEITPEGFRGQLERVPASSLLYVGPATQKKLHRVGIDTIGQLAQAPPRVLRALLGKWGDTLYHYANGQDTSPVMEQDAHTPIKSVGNSLTAARDIVNEREALQIFYVLCESIAQRMRRYGVQGKMISVSLRDTALNTFERQCNLPLGTMLSGEMVSSAMRLLKAHYRWELPLRSLGVRIGALSDAQQMQLNFLNAQRERMQHLEYSIDGIRARFGPTSLQRALLLCDPPGYANPMDHGAPNAVTPGSRECR